MTRLRGMAAMTTSAAMGRRLDSAAATAADLALTYKVPIGTIYRWASLDGWRRSNPKHRPVTYNRDDAEKSYRERRCGEPRTA